MEVNGIEMMDLTFEALQEETKKARRIGNSHNKPFHLGFSIFNEESERKFYWLMPNPSNRYCQKELFGVWTLIQDYIKEWTEELSQTFLEVSVIHLR